MRVPVRFSVDLTGLTVPRALEPPLLSPQQVAERCNVSASTVVAAIQRGELRAARLGRRYRIAEEAVTAWIESQTVRPPGRPVVPFGSLPEPVARPPARDEAGSAARLVALERGMAS
jgi:excisionase family DNA binding protein